VINHPLPIEVFVDDLRRPGRWRCGSNRRRS